MRILIIHNDYQQPGGETVAVNAQIALLRQRGHRVATYRRDNREIALYGIGRKIAFPIYALWSKRTFNEVRALVQRERPDLAHVHNVFPLISPAVYRALKSQGVPIAQTVHNFRFLCPNGLFYTHGQICERCKLGNTFHAARLRCYRQSYILSSLYALSIGLHRRWGTFGMIDCFIALTEFAAGKLLESGLTTQDKIFVLGNFLHDPLPETGSFEKREPYVVYLGRLSPEKGVQILLEAVDGLPNLKVKVAGDGPQAAALWEMTRKRGLHHVELLGQVTGEAKWQLLRGARAAIIPSISYENFPFAVLESLVVGTPVVASNLGSLPYIVQDGQNGLLFRPGDAQDLQEKLAWLVAHPEEALDMGCCARQMVEEEWKGDAHYGRLMGIYSEVVNANARVQAPTDGVRG